MKTYVSISFSSESAPASEIMQTLLDMGFEPTLGTHDLVYDWGDDEDMTPATAINFLDRTQKKLKGMNVLLHFETVQ